MNFFHEATKEDSNHRFENVIQNLDNLVIYFFQKTNNNNNNFFVKNLIINVKKNLEYVDKKFK